LEYDAIPVPAEPASPQFPAVRQRRKRWILPLAAILAVAGAVVAWRVAAKPAALPYSEVRVQRGTITKTITATGKLQALTTVQVGTQVSGTISELYADFNSRVSKGQIIARLDPSQLQAQLTQANANFLSTQAGLQAAQNAVISADAGVQSAEANVERLQAVLDDAQRSYDRTHELAEAGVAARRDLETAQAALAQAAAQKQQGVAQLNQAKAQAQSARSQLNQARAQVQQAQAAVQLASVNLDHTIIRAPIDGVVVARNVDVGQTVAASFQAPTIFMIANDLSRMQVLADIDEADVGQLGPESRVTFTVDAYPSEEFHGKISQIRLSPQTVQNVVTYTAVIDVSNPDLKLKPGMTANVTAVVAERKDVLAIPNAALRFRPESKSTVWKIAEDMQLQPVPVKTGLTDGVSSELLSGELRAGDRLAVAPQAGGEQAGQRAPRSMFPMGRGRR
jgi:HlyD family secretion protein